MATEEALEIVRTAEDEHAVRRAWAVLGLAIKGAPESPPLFNAALLGPGPAGVQRINIDMWLHYYAQIFPTQFGVSEAASRSYAAHLRKLWSEDQVPCAMATSESGFNAKDNYTSLWSKVVALRPLGDILKHLDPRAWAGCGTLFKETCQVAIPAPDDPVCLDTPQGQLGKPWCGLLYEHAAAGPQDVHNLLSVEYRWVPRLCGVRIGYRLWRAIRQTLGGWESPGLMRINSGLLFAFPYRGRPEWTHIWVYKRVHYGRLMSWSSGSSLDYGEFCNYLAPAFLTQWINDLQMVVPCCPGR